MGCVIGLISSTLRGPCHLLQWSPKSNRKLAKGGAGGAAYESSEMVDHVALLRESFAPYADLTPGIVGLEGCESLFTHLGTRRVITEK